MKRPSRLPATNLRVGKPYSFAEISVRTADGKDVSHGTTAGARTKSCKSDARIRDGVRFLYTGTGAAGENYMFSSS
jgi:hypothetical protein